MRIRGFEAGIVALHIHLPATSQTDFPEIQEPDLEDRFTGCADGIARHSTGEVPVQKVKTEAQIVHRRANEVLSQRQFCRAVMGPRPPLGSGADALSGTPISAEGCPKRRAPARPMPRAASAAVVPPARGVSPGCATEATVPAPGSGYGWTRRRPRPLGRGRPPSHG